MKYFNFRRLIEKYASEFKLITLSDGYFNDMGDFVKSESEEVVIQGAVISHRESKVFRSEGTLTAKDKRLFTLEPLDDKLHGLKAIFEEGVYRIEDCTENAKFTGVYAYTLKYQSAFKDTKGAGGVLSD